MLIPSFTGKQLWPPRKEMVGWMDFRVMKWPQEMCQDHLTMGDQSEPTGDQKRTCNLNQDSRSGFNNIQRNTYNIL